MIRAFLLKDLRLASRVGVPLPGVSSLLAVQAVVCFGLAGFSIFVGPIPPELWRGAASLVTTVAFVLAFIGPATQAGFAAAAEGNPDIAESLATAPLGPTHFLLGKAALPAVQGFAMQAALFPTWAFLVANGMLSASDAFRLLVAMTVAVPVAALSGASRVGGPGSARIALMMKAAARRGVMSTPLSAAPAQQTWVALLGMAWVVQVMRNVGVAVPGMSSPISGALQDLVRPVLPVVGLERGSFIRLFGVPAPVVVLSVLLLSAFGVMRVASSVAASPRATRTERERSWRALVAGRALVVFYLAGAAWTISPAASAAIAGCVALWYSLIGYPVLDDRFRIAAVSLVPCVLPALATTAGAGLPGLACWLGILAVCATAAAALPTSRLENDRRTLSAILVVAAGVGPPLLVVALSVPGSPLATFDSLTPVLAAWSWFSLPAAVLSLSSTLLGPLAAWSYLAQGAPSLAAVPPWVAAPAAFGFIAGIARARAAFSEKQRTAQQVG